MGARCCTDRKDNSGHSGGGSGDKPVRKSVRQSVHAQTAYEPRRGVSIGYNGSGKDAAKFDKAFEANDLKGFVELLDSTEDIDKFQEKMHPWAEDPRTVGALAGTQLAILASMSDNPQVKDEIREAGALPKLAAFLKSDQEDRVQTAVVALSFLTAECPDNARAVFQAGAMPKLVSFMDAKVSGMRSAVSTCLRDMMVENMEARLEFVKLGGTKGMVTQLTAEPDPSLNKADVQLEAVLNLQDFVEDSDGNIIPEIAAEVVRCGGKEALQKLLATDDADVKESVEEVLISLEEYSEKQG